ncbi:MAG: SDR family NAD(P)-dependent oxidoreductase, partial [Rhodomicrobium sp.]
MDYNLEGKLAFITGSTKGIGKATAALLLREGAEVIIHGRTRDSVERAKKDLPSAHAVYGDLHNKAAVEKIIEDVKNVGTVQILVNNAGIYEAKAFQDITDEDWLRFFEVNVMSGVRFSRALLPPMLLLNRADIFDILDDLFHRSLLVKIAVNGMRGGQVFFGALDG